MFGGFAPTGGVVPSRAFANGKQEVRGMALSLITALLFMALAMLDAMAALVSCPKSSQANLLSLVRK